MANVSNSNAKFMDMSEIDKMVYDIKFDFGAFCSKQTDGDFECFYDIYREFVSDMVSVRRGVWRISNRDINPNMNTKDIRIYAISSLNATFGKDYFILDAEDKITHKK
jgi:hypothetical protein